MTSEVEHTCEIYLIVEAGPSALDRLGAVLPHIAVPSVLITASGDQPLDAAQAAPLVEYIQAHEVAALITDDARLARVLRADGCHLSASANILAAYEEARDILGSGTIVGVAAGKSRHDAMTLGEAGADYVAFGAPASVRDRERALEVRHAMVEWWAGLFEIPCVAFDITTLAEGEQLARAGADFLAVTLANGLSPADARDRVQEFSAMASRISAEFQP